MDFVAVSPLSVYNIVQRLLQDTILVFNTTIPSRKSEAAKRRLKWQSNGNKISFNIPDTSVHGNTKCILEGKNNICRIESLHYYSLFRINFFFLLLDYSIKNPKRRQGLRRSIGEGGRRGGSGGGENFKKIIRQKKRNFLPLYVGTFSVPSSLKYASIGDRFG